MALYSLHLHLTTRFAKQGCYIYEKEWRLVVCLPPEFWILNDTLKLRVGSLNHLLVNVDPESERGRQ